MQSNRYQRQSIVAQIGQAGQAKLEAARVLIVGVGALGCTVADQLARAGVDSLRLADRDVVDVSNLQRQTLFDESDARRGAPKVEAAARRLVAIRSDLKLDLHALDVDASNLESLVRDIDIIIDGSDNAELRYLINDVAVKLRLPWVMGGAIGMEGRVAAFRAGGPCLRCVFPDSPTAGELATCETAGAVAATIGAVASLQVVEAMKLILGDETAATSLHTLDVWSGRHHVIDLAAARRVDCACCSKRRFDFLDRPCVRGAKLCGRNAVQIRPATPARIDLITLGQRLASIATIEATALMLKLQPPDNQGTWLSVFADGRAIVFGTADLALARTLYARFVGI